MSVATHQQSRTDGHQHGGTEIALQRWSDHVEQTVSSKPAKGAREHEGGSERENRMATLFSKWSRPVSTGLAHFVASRCFH
jgi:hypothetical protein